MNYPSVAVLRKQRPCILCSISSRPLNAVPSTRDLAPLGEYEDEVMDDLAGTYYEETSKGRTKIEDKEKTRKRLHRSPDCGDAVIYGWAPMPDRGVWGVSNASWGY
jgi:hypothetical protein